MLFEELNCFIPSDPFYIQVKSPNLSANSLGLKFFSDLAKEEAEDHFSPPSFATDGKSIIF